MNTYKITNITNLAAKRDSKFNSVLDIEYVDKMSKKIIKLKAGDTVFLTVPTLPLSVHRLRIKNFITVSEVSSQEVANLNKPAKPKAVKKQPVDADEKKYDAKQLTKKKTRKEEESETE